MGVEARVFAGLKRAMRPVAWGSMALNRYAAMLQRSKSNIGGLHPEVLESWVGLELVPDGWYCLDCFIARVGDGWYWLGYCNGVPTPSTLRDVGG